MPSGFLSLEQHIHAAASDSSRIGERGEEIASDYLRRRGFRLVASNFEAPIGRNRRGATIRGEIDIIAMDGETVCFVEVKTRSDSSSTDPLFAVTRAKQRRIERTARAYLKLFGITGRDYRFDAIGVTFNGSRAPSVRHIKNFFNSDSR